MSSPGDPLTSRDSSDPDRCLQFPSSLAPVSSGLCRMWHFKLSVICKTIIIYAIVNLSSYYLLPFYLWSYYPMYYVAIQIWVEYELKTGTKQMLPWDHKQRPSVRVL